MGNVSEQVAGSQCAMPTRRLGHCKRNGRYAYVRGGEVILTLCDQHLRATGCRHLRPFAWEYSYVLDLRTGERMA